jgi:hypothetical protein
MHEMEGHGMTYSPDFHYRYVYRTYPGMNRQRFIDEHLGGWLGWEVEATVEGAWSYDELRRALGDAAFTDNGYDWAGVERQVLQIMKSTPDVARATAAIKSYLAEDIGYRELYSSLLGGVYDRAVAAGGIQTINGNNFVYIWQP